jgi:MFS family permease
MKITNKYIVEVVVFVSYVLFAMAWVGGTASMDAIMATMHLDSLATASFISGAVTFAKIIGTFMAAWLSIKLGVKWAFAFSCLLVAVGIFTPVAESYEQLLISRFLMGLGGALMIVYFNPIVMKWFSANERPTVNGINAVAFNVGTAIILWSFVDINGLSGNWQNSLILFSVLSFLLLLVWLLVDWNDGDESKSQQTNNSEDPAEYTYSMGLKDSFNWYYSLTYAGLLSFYICLFTFYPKAGIVASKWVIGFGILGTIAGLIYSNKIKQRISVIRWSGFIQIITIMGLSFIEQPIVQMICAMILGFFVFLPMIALVSIPHELPKMNPQKITVVFSLFWSISYLFATIALWLFGLIVDMNEGSYFQAFLFITVVSSTFFIGSFFLPETQPKTIKEGK